MRAAGKYGPLVSALRVVLADDNYLVREGLAALLGEIPGMDVVGRAGDLHSLLDVVAGAEPDAVLTDIRMPPTFADEGIRAARQIRAAHGSTGVVVLSQYAEETYAVSLLADGAEGMGYLLKERVSDVDQLAHALREVARGGSVLDPKVVERLLHRGTERADSGMHHLTSREFDVLREMASGRSNLMIAKTLYLSERAVEKHIGTLFQKLALSEEGDVNRRVMAVLAYLDATDHHAE